MNTKPTLKISWSDVPCWAEYIAVDADGAIWCYEAKPRVGRIMHLGDKAKILGVMEIKPDYDWKKLIWKRP